MLVGAPAMSMATLRMPRRTALMLALAVFAAGHAAAALSSSFSLLLGARFVTALAVGAFWAVGAPVATEAAGPRARARAMGVMIGGLTLANVIGVPLGTAFGEALGWRGPFWILAGLAVVALPVTARQVPADGERGQLSVRAEIAALRQVRVWVVFLATALFQAGLIALYSYVSPLSTSLGLRGPALTGLVLTLASIAPLTALAVVRGRARSRPGPVRSREPEPTDR